ncbi:Alpha-amylase [Balamuthia mandrillaris]
MKTCTVGMFLMVVLLCAAAIMRTTTARSIPVLSTNEEAFAGLPTELLGSSRQPPLNQEAGKRVLYEVQLRTANACWPGSGTSAQQKACAAKIAPNVTYRAVGEFCPSFESQLKPIKLGTIHDMLQNTTDYKDGLTLNYIKNTVGATSVWVMPPFPNNDVYNLPDPCDNLGSPYAVRDFFHLSGALSTQCIKKGLDEYTNPPCWANADFDKLIQQADKLGLEIWLDLSFNHFGYYYMTYDYLNYTSITTRIQRGEDLNQLWNFDKTFDPTLLHPTLMDDPRLLASAIANNSFDRPTTQALIKQCPAQYKLFQSAVGNQDWNNATVHRFVRLFNMWRMALPQEREAFNCSALFMEDTNYGFYLGSNSWDPSQGSSDFFTNNWRDVKFLYHHENNVLHNWEFVRNREYLFRVMNYWVSRGVRGFRLDHTTDPNGGMAANEWKYITTKVDFYAAKRGQPRPIYLAEEFHEQMSIGQVLDIETEGYVGDMCGRSNPNKDAYSVERVVSNTLRFNGDTFVMTALETHDEHRLLEGTGFDIWTGSGFWGIGATLWSTPMILMGQEFGERWGLGFKKSDYIRSRFVGEPNYNPQGEELVKFYNKLINIRLSNAALTSPNFYFLRTKQGNAADTRRIYASMKWASDGSNVVFVFHNLWNTGQDVGNSYYIPPDVASAAQIKDGNNYKLFSLLDNAYINNGQCWTGAQLKWELKVSMASWQRVQWLRLELC